MSVIFGILYNLKEEDILASKLPPIDCEDLRNKHTHFECTHMCATFLCLVTGVACVGPLCVRREPDKFDRVSREHTTAANRAASWRTFNIQIQIEK